MGKVSIQRSFCSTSGTQWTKTSKLVLDRKDDVLCRSACEGETQLESRIFLPQRRDEERSNALPEVPASQSISPLHPRHIPDCKLPFVPAEEVTKRDGKEGAKLCSCHVLKGRRLLTNAGIVVDGIVLDCTYFKKKHPGGKAIIESFGGQDCSWQVCRMLRASSCLADCFIVVVVPFTGDHGETRTPVAGGKDDWCGQPTC